MILKNQAGDRPRVAATAWVHPTAVIIGNVEIADSVFIGPNAVIRSDEPGPDDAEGMIVLEAEVNVQDGVIIHALGGTGVRIGTGSSIAHGAIVHGPCEIGADSFVGFNSVIFKASLGVQTIVLHQALVEDAAIPGGLLVPSMTAVKNKEDVTRLSPAAPEFFAFARKVRQTNAFLVEMSKSELE